MNDLYINVKIIDDISVLEGDGNYTHQYTIESMVYCSPGSSK